MKQKRFNLIQILVIIFLFFLILEILFYVALYSVTKKKESLAIQTVHRLVDGAKMLSSGQQFNDEVGQVVVQFVDGNVDYSQYNVSAEIPKTGTIHIASDGGLELKVWNDELEICVEKSFADADFKITDTSLEECKIDVNVSCPAINVMGKEIVSCEMMRNDPDGNLRYVGSDPSNYVIFNNELWRIIGVFDGQAKIIRNDFYSTSIDWDFNALNDWNQSSLMMEFNGMYFNSIDEVSKSYIDTYHVWNIGGYDDTYQMTGTRSNFYQMERGQSISSVMTASTWTGAIGLMYPSDYGYATSSVNAECDSTVMSLWDRTSGVNNCTHNSWLFNDSYIQWTLTSSSSNSNYVFFIGTTGFVDYYLGTPYYTTGAKPVLYLNSNVSISGGSGTINDPFTLSMIY